MRGTLAAITALLVTAPAAATFGLQFNDVDINDDGGVQLFELRGAEFFARQDLDGNEVIQADELGNEWLFALWDVNDDYDLSPEEFYQGMLTYADTNGDDRLGPVEFQRTQTDWSFGEPIESPGGSRFP